MKLILCIGFQLPIFNRLSLVKIKQTTFDCGEKEKYMLGKHSRLTKVFFFSFFFFSGIVYGTNMQKSLLSKLSLIMFFFLANTVSHKQLISQQTYFSFCESYGSGSRLHVILSSECLGGLQAWLWSESIREIACFKVNSDVIVFPMVPDDLKRDFGSSLVDSCVAKRDKKMEFQRWYDS